jgi:fatty acid desaturase
MEIVKTPLIAIAAGILAAGLASLLNWQILILLIITFLPLTTIWVAWRILRDDHQVEEHFEHQFYQDWEYQRAIVRDERNIK